MSNNKSHKRLECMIYLVNLVFCSCDCDGTGGDLPRRCSESQEPNCRVSKITSFRHSVFRRG